MKVILSIDNDKGMFQTNISDEYYDTLRDLILVFSRHTLKSVEVVE